MPKITPPNNLDPELWTYAFQVVADNSSYREIRAWLKNHSYDEASDLKKFFSAVTLVKFGRLEENDYRFVVQEFKARHELEMQQTYSPGFSFSQTRKSVLSRELDELLNYTEEETREFQPSQ
jgi:hypothetical protein